MQQSLVQRDLRVIWHPFTPQKPLPEPIPIVRGEGSWLIDDTGKRYLDAISSWWVTLHGHAHPAIAEALYGQARTLEQVIFAGFTHEPAVTLAEELLNLLPGPMNRIFYSDNGSTSTEVALKMAIQYWWNQGRTGRRKILALRNSYHGDTFGAMSVSDRGVFTLAFHNLLFEVVFVDALTLDNIGEAKEIVHRNRDEFAAFIYEPLVQGAGGMNMYDAYALNEFLNTCKLEGIICIADEVMTGFGRTGKFFASDHLHKKPDIICLSKGLTGGTLPLGVTACTDRIYQAFVQDDQLKTFFHGHSFTANPLACTAAITSLRLLQEEDCLRRLENIVQKLGDWKRQLVRFAEGHPVIKNIRQLGTIVAFEINSEGRDEYLNQSGKKLGRYCMDRGVYIRPLGNTVYVMPPYCFTSEQLDVVTQTILEGLAQP